MAETKTRTGATILDLVSIAAEDPWSLALEDRARVASSTDFADVRDQWKSVLPALVEPPAPDPATFPFWLFETAKFRALRIAIGDSMHRGELSTATADELQRFVDLFACYATELDPLGPADDDALNSP